MKMLWFTINIIEFSSSQLDSLSDDVDFPMSSGFAQGNGMWETVRADRWARMCRIFDHSKRGMIAPYGSEKGNGDTDTAIWPLPRQHFPVPPSSDFPAVVGKEICVMLKDQMVRDFVPNSEGGIMDGYLL